MEGPSHSARRPARQGGAAVRLVLVLGLVVPVFAGLVGPTPVDVTSLAQVANPPAGTLDTTFDGDGIATTEIDSLVTPVDAAVQFAGGDERILVLDRQGRRIWRFRPDGTLDRTFDDDGVLPLNLFFSPERLTVSPADGSFAVAGFGGGAVRVARFGATGAPDTGFGTSGTATVMTVTEPQGVGDCPTLDRTFTSLADIGSQSNGAIIVTGAADVEVDGSTEFVCDPQARPGLAAARLNAQGEVDAVGSHVPCAGEVPELADPRSLTVTDDDRVVVSMAMQCPASIDPVEVVGMTPDLDVEMTGVSPFQPTAGQSFPIVVRDDGTVAVAARAATGGFEAWNLLRWEADGTFIGVNTAQFAPGVTTTSAVGLGLTPGDGFVVAGPALVGAGRTSIGLVTYAADGTPTSPPTLVDHPGAPPTSVTTAALVTMADGSHRLVGHAEPEIFGLDSQREVMLTRLTTAGAFDPAFGPDATGFALHRGTMGASGRAVAVRLDNRVVVGGRISVPIDGGDRTGFVLQHQEGGTLDPAFSPDHPAGIEITRYAAAGSPSSLTPPAPTPAAAAASVGTGAATGGHLEAAGVGTVSQVLAQAEPTVEVDTEAELRTEFGDPATTHITLTADISVSGDEIPRATSTPLVIEGDGHVISRAASTTGRIFFWDGAGDLTLNNLTLTGADTTGGSLSGGAVDMSGSFTATNTTFSGNSAGGWGGAIAAGGTITVTDSTFVGNTAGIGGGAIEAFGTEDVIITDSTFDTNAAVTRGGAIVAQSSNVSVLGSTFTQNTVTPIANECVTDPDDNCGGGAIWAASGDVTLTDSDLDDNQAYIGGAVAAVGTVTVAGSRLTENLAQSSSLSDGGGGAIWAVGAVDVEQGSVLDDNISGLVGGGIYVEGPITIEDSTFERNGDVHTGGGVYAVGSIDVARSHFEDNQADFNGGAIYAQAPPGGAITGTITDSVFDGNGGATSAGDGGAVVLHGALSVSRSTFTLNIAVNGGAIYSWSIVVEDSSFRDNHGVLGGALYISNDEGHIIRTEFLRNRTDLNNASDAGAIYGGDIVIVDQSVFDSNHAGEQGGAIQAFQIVARDSRFTRNDSNVDGGALHADDTVTLERTTFVDNASLDGSGGAVWADTVSADASLFSGNGAASDGGAIAADGQVEVVNSTLDGNEAGSSGGAIHTFGPLDLRYATVVANSGLDQVLAEGSLTTFGSVVAGPVGGGTNCAGETTVSSSAYSYSTDDSCDFTGTGDTMNGSSPQLEGLANNGGPTQTRRPAQTSPLISAIPPAACAEAGIAVDQRGVSRPQGSACDIGAVEVQEGSVDIQVEGLTLDSQGRTVIAGRDTVSDQAVIHRLLPDGEPDPAFFGGHPLRWAPSAGVLRDVIVDTAGRIVAVGDWSVPDSYRRVILVVRLLPDGTPDPAFSSDGQPGVVRIEPGTELLFWEAEGNAIAEDDAGRLVLTGWAFDSSSTPALLVARLLDDGARDATFGGGSILGDGVVLGLPGDNDPATTHLGEDLATVGTNIVVVGTRTGSGDCCASESPTPDAGFVARFGGVGALVNTFGNAGVALPFGTGSQSAAYGVAIDAIGDIVVAGAGSRASEGPILLGRVLPNGTPDALFGDGGRTATSLPASVAAAADVALAPDGKIVVTGHARDDRGTRVVTARYNPGDAILACTPDPADAGAVVVGESADVVVTCTALEGRARIDAVAVDPASAHPADYAISTDGCTGVILPMGGTCNLTITFTPGAVDARTAALTVDHTTVTGIKPPEVVGLVGEGIELPEFVATPDPVVFGLQQLGTISPSQTVTGTNVGGTAMTITNVAIVGANADDFALIGSDCPATSLDPGGSCTVEISFTPRAGSIGVRQASLRFVDTAPGSPHTVTLRGQGGRAASFTVEPDPVEFDPQRLGTTSPSRLVTGTNVGDFPLTITQVTTAGIHADDFTIDDTTCPGTLAPGATCTAEVSFTPTSDPLANRQALLRFDHTAPGSPHVVRLRGRLLEPVIDLDPDEGPVETEVTVTGELFEPGVEVQILVGDVVIATVPADQVDDDGAFSIVVVIPEGTPGGEHAIVACQRCDADRPIQAQAPFTVTPRLFLEPGLGTPGFVTQARGDGFLANVPIVLRWDQGIGNTRVDSDEAGEIRVQVLIFPNDRLGLRELQASISESTEVAATAPFLVVAGTSDPQDLAFQR